LFDPRRLYFLFLLASANQILIIKMSLGKKKTLPDENGPGSEVYLASMAVVAEFA